MIRRLVECGPKVVGPCEAYWPAWAGLLMVLAGAVLLWKLTRKKR